MDIVDNTSAFKGWKAVQFGANSPDWLLFHNGGMYSKTLAEQAAEYLEDRGRLSKSLNDLATVIEMNAGELVADVPDRAILYIQNLEERLADAEGRD